MRIWKDFTFDAAHHLPMVDWHHKCRRVHGHTYKVTVCVEGEPGADGMIVDYEDIAAAWRLVAVKLDHFDLNAIEGLENPTTEILVKWIWQRMKPNVPGLARIVIHESSTTGCEYDGPH